VEVANHYKLVQIDLAAHSDKYYIIQTLSGPKKGRGKGSFHFVFTRWGHTGTKGQARLEDPMQTAEEAEALAGKKFKEKTGNDVSTVADGTFAAKGGKYRLVVGDTGATISTEGRNGGCLWQCAA